MEQTLSLFPKIIYLDIFGGGSNRLVLGPDSRLVLGPSKGLCGRGVRAREAGFVFCAEEELESEI